MEFNVPQLFHFTYRRLVTFFSGLPSSSGGLLSRAKPEFSITIVLCKIKMLRCKTDGKSHRITGSLVTIVT